jgi:hypothetical protein
MVVLFLEKKIIVLSFKLYICMNNFPLWFFEKQLQIINNKNVT